MATENITVAISEEGGGGNKLVETLKNIAAASDKAATSTDKSAAATKRAGSAATQSAGDHNILTRALGGVQGGYGLLSAAIGGFLGKLSLEKLSGYADTYTNIRNKLQLVTPTQVATNKAMEASFEIAQRNRTSWEGTADVYGKISNSLQSMGKDASLAAKLTDTVTKAVSLSGSSAESAKAGLLQFGQALGSGKLAGDELTSILENLPGLSKALAEGLKVPVGSLKELASQGKLTSKDLVDALEKAGPKVAAAFAQTAPTMAQAWQVIENAAMKYVGTTNSAYSVTGMISTAMIGLANNMNIVAPIMATLVGLMVTMAAVSLASALYQMVAGFVALAGSAAAAALAMGTALLIPLAAVAAAAGVGVAAMKLFGISLSDVGTYVLDLIAKIPGLSEVIKNLRDYFGTASEKAKGFASAADIAAASTKTYNAQGQLTGAIINGVRVELDKTNASFGNAKQQIDSHTKSTQTNTGAQKELSNALRTVKEDLNQHGEKIDDVRKSEFEYYENLRKLNAEMLKNTRAEMTRETEAAAKAFDTANDNIGRYYGTVAKAAGGTNTQAEAMADMARETREAWGETNTLTTSLNNAAPAYLTISSAANALTASFSAQAQASRAAASAMQEQINAATVAAQKSASMSLTRDVTTSDYKQLGNAPIVTGGFSVDYGNTLDYGGSKITDVWYAGNMGTGLDPHVGGFWDLKRVQAVQKELDMLSEIDSSVPKSVVKSWISQSQRTPILDNYRAWKASKDRAAGTTPTGTSGGNVGMGMGLGFAGGGSFVVDGLPGTDTNLVQFKASRGEEVTIAKPRDVRKGSSADSDNDNRGKPQDRRAVTLVIKTPDTNSFRRTSRQVAQDAKRMLQKIG